MDLSDLEVWWSRFPEPTKQRIVAILEVHLAAVRPLRTEEDTLVARSCKIDVEELHRLVEVCGGADKVSSPEYLEKMDEVAFLDRASGDIRLAIASCELWKDNIYAAQFGVYHGGRSGDGVKELVWERMGKRWEWIQGRDSLASAGNELIALGGRAEEVGRIVRAYAHGGTQMVADMLVYYGGEEMGAEVREFVKVAAFADCSNDFEVALVQHLSGHTEVLRACADLGDGHVITGSDDESIKFWDLDQGRCVKTIEAHRHFVSALSVFPDKKQIVSASMDGMIKLWDVDSGKLVRGAALIGHTRGTFSVVAVNATTFISCGSVGELAVWTLDQGVWDSTFKTRQTTSSVNCICVLRAPGKGGSIQFVTAGGDQVIRLWALDVARPLVQVKGVGESVSDIAELWDGRIVSVGFNGVGKVWPAKLVKKSKPEKLLISDGNSLNTVAVLHRLKLIATGGKRIKIWSLGEEEGISKGKAKMQGDLVMQFSVHTDAVVKLVELDDGRLLSASWDRLACVWDLKRKLKQGSLVDQGNMVAATVLEDGRHVTTSHDEVVWVWKKPERGKVLELESRFSGNTVLSCLTKFDGGLAGGGEDMRVYVWKEKGEDGGWRMCMSMSGHSQWIGAIIDKPGPDPLLISGCSHLVIVWNRDGMSLHKFRVGGKALAWLDFPVLAVGGYQGVFRIDVTEKDGKPKDGLPSEIEGPRDWIDSLLVVEDGKVVVTAGWDRAIAALSTGADLRDDVYEPVGRRYVVACSLGGGYVLLHEKWGRELELWTLSPLKKKRVFLYVDDEISRVFFDAKTRLLSVIRVNLPILVLEVFE